MKRTSNHSEQRLFREEVLSFTREICVCAHLTQTRDAQRACAEMRSSVKKGKIIFAASSGGHFEQLMMLKPLMEKYDSVLVTEETGYGIKNQGVKTCYMKQINRREKWFFLKFLENIFRSLGIVLRERPQVMITTGVLAMVPMAFWVKLTGGKLIYLESFAKVTSKTLSGKILYRIADRFYVQWEEMLKLYPKAIYKGGIY